MKVLERERSYANERDAYLRFTEKKMTLLGIFDVPRLIDYDNELLVVEMAIVTPPYLLDFGKAYVDRSPPYTKEQLTESLEECRQLFDTADWPNVEEALLDLKLLGIVYLDIKPANIRMR
ncbi:MAG: hypothetical protein WBD31_09640 [Rubripirellula sp.]